MLTPVQLLIVWLGFFLGVLVADMFTVTELFYWVLGGVVCIAATGWVKQRGVSTKSAQVWLTALLTCVVFLAGVGRMEYASQQFRDSDLRTYLGQESNVTGQVVREPDQRERFTQLTVRVADELVLVRTNPFLSVAYGDELGITGTVEQPDSFETDLGRTFDYPNYLKARGIQYVIPFADVTVTDSGGGNQLLRLLFAGKEQFATAITRVVPSPEAELGLGLLLGIKQALGDELETAFRQTGLIHIVVLSGYNVMLVVGFFWWVSSWVLPLTGRVWFGLIGVTLFALLVGLSATVVRASIMAAILLLAKYIGTRYDVLRALLFAALVMVMVNPYLLLYDLGFQLSFIATLALVLVLPQFESTIATDTTSVTLRDIFLATTVTQIAVTPLLMYAIGEVSLVSVLVNVLVLPVVAVAMMCTFATGVLALISPQLAAPLAFLALISLTYIITIVEWFAAFSYAAVLVPEISLGEMMGMYGGLGLLYWWWRSRTSLRSTSNTTDKLSDWTIEEEVRDKKTPVIFQ